MQEIYQSGDDSIFDTRRAVGRHRHHTPLWLKSNYLIQLSSHPNYLPASMDLIGMSSILSSDGLQRQGPGRCIDALYYLHISSSCRLYAVLSNFMENVERAAK